VCGCVCVWQWERERAHTHKICPRHLMENQKGDWCQILLAFKTNKTTPPPKHCYWGWFRVIVYDPETKHRRKSSRSQKLSSRSCWMVLIYLLIHFINLLIYPFTCLFVDLLISLFISLIYSFIHSLIFNLWKVHPNVSQLDKRNITFLVSKSANIWQTPFYGKGC